MFSAGTKRDPREPEAGTDSMSPVDEAPEITAPAAQPAAPRAGPVWGLIRHSPGGLPAINLSGEPLATFQTEKARWMLAFVDESSEMVMSTVALRASTLSAASPSGDRA